MDNGNALQTCIDIKINRNFNLHGQDSICGSYVKEEHRNFLDSSKHLSNHWKWYKIHLKLNTQWRSFHFKQNCVSWDLSCVHSHYWHRMSWMLWILGACTGSEKIRIICKWQTPLKHNAIAFGSPYLWARCKWNWEHYTGKWSLHIYLILMYLLRHLVLVIVKDRQLAWPSKTVWKFLFKYGACQYTQ